MVEEISSSSSQQSNSCPIKTVVVLVMENRSFDHMLGWMKSLNQEINGVTTGNQHSNQLNTTDPNSGRIFFGNSSVYVDPDPGHSIQDIYEQIFGEPWSESSASKKLVPAMQGFAQNAERIQQGMSEAVMNGFEPEKLPVYKNLVSEFGICDRWFASVPASTQPNRMYVHAATSHGATSNDKWKLIQGFPQKTIFESMYEEGYDFGIYYQQVPSTFFYRNLRKLKYFTKFHLFDLHFKKHCEEGKLPNYVVIEPRFFDLLGSHGNDDHPSHDVSQGQKFVKEVYEALRASPQWNEILFIITYDEHGGFYDHVPTPVEGVPSPDDIVGFEPYNFQFDRLGVRVPAIFISPWIEKATVLHKPSGPYPTSEYEHSSIPATVKKIFNLKEFLTKRDAWAGTFEGILTRRTPRTDCPVTLPEPVKLRDAGPNENARLTEFQEELVQMAAVLKGDHDEDIYPDKLVEDMTVSDAAKYIEEALNKYYDECEKSKNYGTRDLDDVVVVTKPASSASSKSFAEKLFSCIVCDH